MGLIERTLWRCIEHSHVWWLDEPDPDEGEAYCFQCDRQADVEEFKVVDASQLAGAVDLLRDVANSAPEFEDPRMGYVVVQIDRPTWEALAPYRTGGQ